MKAVRTLYFVLLSVGVVAPVAASPAVPAAAWPGVSDVLLTVAAPAPVAAWPGVLAAWPGLRHPHFVGMGTPSKAATWGCYDQSLQRLVAEWAYRSDEGVTDNAFGTTIFQKRDIVVPEGCDTLYVTIVATFETPEDEDVYLDCKVDALHCISAFTESANDKGMGWIKVLSDIEGAPFDFTSNVNVSYTWCIKIAPGSHSVSIDMAPEENDEIAVTDAFFYVDASFTNGGCIEADPTGVRRQPFGLPLRTLPRVGTTLPAAATTPTVPVAPTPTVPTVPALPTLP